MQDPGSLPGGRHFRFPGAAQRQDANSPDTQQPSQSQPAAPAATPPPSAPPASPRAAAPSLLDKPAEPAKVSLTGGVLSVQANNSSLTQILHQLSSSSGMSIDGLGQDQRIFGSYGPGTPRDVLSSLLDGAGYNVLMLGETNAGAPRELVLTARSNAPASSGQNNASSQQEEEEDDQSANNNLPEPPPPPPQPTAPVQTQNPNGGVKTPAQILQELQTMRSQQQQQQGQQPPQ